MAFDSDPWNPANPGNRDRTRESRRQIRALLMDWDPIGVAGIEEAADEYDCMISPLMHQLYDGATTDALCSWIGAERTGHFGLGPDDDSDSALAERLTQWWVRRISPSNSSR